MTPKEFFEFAKKNQAEMVDLKFVDLLGTWQHCTFPVDFLDEKTFKEGLGFDSPLRRRQVLSAQCIQVTGSAIHRRLASTDKKG